MSLFPKSKNPGIDLSKRLAGRNVGTGTPVVTEQESDGEDINNNVISLTREVPLGDGKSVYFPPGQNLAPLDVPTRVKRTFPVYSGGLNADWPTEGGTILQSTSVFNGENDNPANQTQKPVETSVSETHNYQQPSLLNGDLSETATNLRTINEKTENAVVKEILEKISQLFGQRILDEKDSETFRNDVFKAIDDKLKDEARRISFERRPVVAKRIYNLIFGYGPLQQLFDDKYSEIMVSRYDNIFVEQDGKLMYTGIKFGSEEELQTLIKTICGKVGRTISVSSPLCDGELKEERSRFNAVLPPIAVDGAQLTIRRFPEKKLTGEDYIRFGSLDRKILDFLELAIRAKWTTICSGGTGSGKTSLLNLVSSFLKYDLGLSVITIEDSLELCLDHPNVRRKLTRISDSMDKSSNITTRQLVKNSLRERPDVIVIGEIRDGTMADFLNATQSGHDGCLTTVHANSPQELGSRVVSLFMMSEDYNLDSDTISRMYATSIDLVIQIRRYEDHVRRISHISHVVGYGDMAAEELGIKPGDRRYSPNRVYVRDIFHWRKTGQHKEKFINTFTGNEEEHLVLEGKFEATGYIPKGLIEKASTNGIEIDESIFKNNGDIET